MSNTQYTIDKATVRDDVGHYRLRQCKSNLRYAGVVSRHIVEKNRRTVGDILNKLQFNNLLRSIVIQKS